MEYDEENKVRLVQTDRVKELIVLDVRKSKIEDILGSIDVMTERQQRFLLD